MQWRLKFGELSRHRQRMCSTYGAPDFSCHDSQAFRPGLTFAASTALAPRRAAGHTAMAVSWQEAEERIRRDVRPMTEASA